MPPISDKPGVQPVKEAEKKIDFSALGLKPEKQRGGAWRLVGFSFTIFIIIYGGYAGLNFGYRPYLENQIAEENQRIQSLTAEVPEEEQTRFRNLYFQLRNLKDILDRRTFVSAIFPILEGLTHARVTWENFSINVRQHQLILGGYTQSYITLVQQMDAFSEAPEIQSYTLSSVGIRKEDNVLTFNVTLNLDPKIFKL